MSIIPKYTLDFRLQDVIALIQVLSFEETALRTEDGLEIVIGKPKSSKKGNWEDIAVEHPEFFRFNKEVPFPFSLIARYAKPPKGNGQREVLSIDYVLCLLNLATTLHDKEIKRKENWKIWFPPIMAAIPGVISLLISLYITLC